MEQRDPAAPAEEGLDDSSPVHSQGETTTTSQPQFMIKLLQLARSESPAHQSEAAEMVSESSSGAIDELAILLNGKIVENLRKVVHQAHPRAVEVRRSIAKAVTTLNCRQPPPLNHLPPQTLFKLLLELGIDSDQETAELASAGLAHLQATYFPIVFADQVSVGFLIHQWLPKPDTGVQEKALELLSYALGDPTLQSSAVATGILEHLRFLLAHPQQQIQVKACRALEVILESTIHFQAVINAGLVPVLFTLPSDINWNLHLHRPQPNYAVALLMSSPDEDQVRYLIQEGVLDFIAERLVPGEAVLDLLYSLGGLLEVGDTIRNAEGLASNPFVDALKLNGGLDSICRVSTWGWDREIGAVEEILTLFFR